MDFLYLGTIVLFFALSWWLIQMLDRLSTRRNKNTMTNEQMDYYGRTDDGDQFTNSSKRRPV